MMNQFGKILVLVQTALSVIFMTWAVMIYLEFNDFGWKDPRKIWTSKEAGYRVASMLDKRTAVLHEMYRQKDRSDKGMKPALETLSETMEFFPKNHQFYVAELEKIRTSDDPISPKALTWKDGQLVIDTPGKALGKPIMKAAVPNIDKSTKKVNAELNAILADIEKTTTEVAELVKKADEITVQLYGTKDDKGNSVDIGLYEVLDIETTLQDKLREEREYITPKYVDALRRAAGFRERYEGMIRTVNRLNAKP